MEPPHRPAITLSSFNPYNYPLKERPLLLLLCTEKTVARWPDYLSLSHTALPVESDFLLLTITLGPEVRPRRCLRPLSSGGLQALLCHCSHDAAVPVLLLEHRLLQSREALTPVPCPATEWCLQARIKYLLSDFREKLGWQV